MNKNIVVLNCKVNETFERKLLVEKIENDFYAFVLTGTANDSAAMISKVEHLSKVELEAAIGVDDYAETDLGISLAKQAGIFSEDAVSNQLAKSCEELVDALPDDSSSQYKKIRNYLEEATASYFVEHIIVANVNRNSWIGYITKGRGSELEGAVNADDCYVPVIVDRCLGDEDLKAKVFEVFSFDRELCDSINAMPVDVRAKLNVYKEVRHEHYEKMVATMRLLIEMGSLKRDILAK